MSRESRETCQEAEVRTGRSHRAGFAGGQAACGTILNLKSDEALAAQIAVEGEIDNGNEMEVV